MKRASVIWCVAALQLALAQGQAAEPALLNTFRKDLIVRISQVAEAGLLVYRDREPAGEVFLLVDAGQGFLNGQALQVTMWPCGSCIFTNVTGAKKPVKRFTLKPEKAIFPTNLFEKIAYYEQDGVTGRTNRLLVLNGEGEVDIKILANSKTHQLRERAMKEIRDEVSVVDWKRLLPAYNSRQPGFQRSAKYLVITLADATYTVHSDQLSMLPPGLSELVGRLEQINQKPQADSTDAQFKDLRRLEDFFFTNDPGRRFRWVKLSSAQASNTVTRIVANVPAATQVKVR